MVLEVKKSFELDSRCYQDALAIRRAVFIEEQGIDARREIESEKGPCYYVGYYDTRPVVTARVIQDNKAWTIQRVCVLPEMRGHHLGQVIMNSIERDAINQHIKILTLHAQEHAKEFYEGLNYQVVGEKFRDAGIWHYTMVKQL